MSSVPVVVIAHSRRSVEVLHAHLAWGGYPTPAPISPSRALEKLRAGEHNLLLVLAEPSSFLEAGLTVLRADAVTERVPVLAWTRPTDPDARARALDAGATFALDADSDRRLLVTTLQLLVHERTAVAQAQRRERDLDELRVEQRTVLDALVHDLKNPLAVVLANIGWALDYIPATEGDVRDGLLDAQEGARKLESLIEELSMLRRLESSGPGKRESIRVSELVRRVVSDRAPEAQSRDVTVVTEVDDALEFTGDTAVLRQLLDGMLESSIRAAPRMGTIALSADTRAGLEIALRSVAPPARDASGPASARTPSAALRLYFCKKVVEAFRGELEVDDSSEASRSVVVRLPAVGT